MADRVIRVVVDSTAARQGGQEVKAALGGIGAEAQKAEAQLRKMSAETTVLDTTMGQMVSETARAVAVTNSHTMALERNVRSAQQQRAAFTQLSFQVQDVSQAIALGVNPLTILAQQGGQTAYAISQLGGKLGAVGAIMSGVWGSAIIAGVSILGGLIGSFISARREAENYSEALDAARRSTDDLTAAERALKELRGDTILTTREVAKQTYLLAQQKREDTLETIKSTEAVIAWTRAQLDARDVRDTVFAGVGGFGPERTASRRLAVVDRLDELQTKLDAMRTELGKTGQDVDKAFARVSEAGFTLGDIFNDANRAANDNAEANGRVSGSARSAAAGMRDFSGSMGEFIAKAEQAEQTDFARTLDELTRKYDPLTAAARDYADELERIAELESRGIISGDQAGAFRRASINAENDAISNAVNAPLRGLDLPFQEAGKKGGQAFRDEGLLAVEAIAQAFGGKMGHTVQSIAGLLQGMTSGDFTGVRGELGGVLTLFSGQNGQGPFVDGMKEVFQDIGLTGDGFKSITGKLDKIFGGAEGSGVFVKGLGKAFAGAAVGTAADGIMDALGVKSSRTGAQIGGAVGSFLPIPGGEIIGSIAGGLLGGVLKGTPRGSATITSIDGTPTTRGSSNSREQASVGLAGSVQEGLRNIADSLGAEIGAFRVSIGVRNDDFRVDTSGQGRTKTKRGAIDFGQDEEAAIRFAIRDAIRDGALQGISAFSQRVLAGTTDLDRALDLAAKYEEVLKRLAANDNPIKGAAEQFSDQFTSLAESMRKVGATAEELANVEKLYSQEREKALTAALKPLEDFKKSLSGEGSGVTAVNRLSEATAAYEKAKADFAAGKIDQATFTQAGQERFALSRDVFGTSTPEFQSIRQQMIADANAALGTARDQFKAGAPERLQEAMETQNTIATQSYQQLAQINAILREIAERGNNPRLGGGSGGSGIVNGSFSGPSGLAKAV